MQAISQISSISELELLAKGKRHSILIEGSEGVGKTYLAKQYSNMLNISDFQVVEPKVQNIKDAIDICINIHTPVVVCIENLDLGVLAASYTLLKFLEEPTSNVYVVVTCRNIQNIPDTIISRSECVTVAPPTTDDILNYAKESNELSYDRLFKSKVMLCASNYNDIDDIFKFNSQQLEYITSLIDELTFKDSISSIIWKIQKYPDGSDTPIKLIIKYIMTASNDNRIWRAGHSCIQDLSTGRLSTNAVVAKFLFDCKYTA